MIRRIGGLGAIALWAGLVGVTLAPEAVADGAENAGVAIVVSTGADVVADDGLCSLREAIEAADTDTVSGVTGGECAAGSGADLIGFAVGGPFVLSVMGELVIDSELHIDGGAGVVVDGGGASHVFTVAASGAVTFQGLTVTGADIGLSVDGTATVIGLTVFDNADTGISSLGGGVIVEQSTVSGNGGSGVTGRTLVISDSVISANGGVGVAVTGGYASSVSRSTISDNSGGGVQVDGGLSTSISDSRISGNQGTGGILSAYPGGPTSISNTTISGNTGAASLGGGVTSFFGTVDVAFSTITDNTAVGGAGILAFYSPVVSVSASVVADNHGGDVDSYDVPAAFASGGYNVIGDGDATGAFTAVGDVFGVSAVVGPLADNGGATLTHLPLLGSPAVDRVASAVGTDPPLDQRGVSRPQGPNKDAGAVEREDLWVRPFGAVILEGDSGTSIADVVVYLEDGNGDPVTSITDVTVDYATVDVYPNPRVAQAGSDFISTAGTLTIPAGTSQATVPVEIIGDTVHEPDLLYGEWALLAFADPSPNARLNVGFFGLGLVIIGNDDPPP